MPRNPQHPNDLQDDADERRPLADAGATDETGPITFTVPSPDPLLGWAGVGVERVVLPPDPRLGEGEQGEGV